MRIIMNIILPHDEFNDAVRDGTAGETLQEILAEAKPETVYFTKQAGQRGAVLVVDVADASGIPGRTHPPSPGLVRSQPSDVVHLLTRPDLQLQ